jgi:hypothetical protein
MTKAEPRFDLDLGYGLNGEATAMAWHQGKHEVKTKRYRDLKFYVELEQNTLGSGWRLSGLNTSESPYWEFVIDTTGVVVALPKVRLTRAVHLSWGVAKEEKDGDNPTRGRLLSLTDLLDTELDRDPESTPMTLPVCATFAVCGNEPDWHCSVCWRHLLSVYASCPDHPEVAA